MTVQIQFGQLPKHALVNINTYQGHLSVIQDSREALHLTVIKI